MLDLNSMHWGKGDNNIHIIDTIDVMGGAIWEVVVSVQSSEQKYEPCHVFDAFWLFSTNRGLALRFSLV